MPSKLPKLEPLLPRMPDQTKEHERVYATARWKRVRKLQLSRFPLCNLCNQPANEVHHKTEVSKDQSKAFDLNNLESLCHSCHSKITAGKK